MTPSTIHDSPSSDFVAFAHQLADAAGAALRPYFGAHGDIEAKADNSPVTAADRAAEHAMRQLIESHYPDHVIYGEEFGLSVTSRQSPVTSEKDTKKLATDDWRLETAYTWVIDPIDGTRAFIAGRKEWGTLIALCENGIPILGILDQPVTGERWVGIKGQPARYCATLASEPDPTRRAKEIMLKTRPCSALAQAEFSTTSAAYFTPVQAARVVKWAQACRATVKDGDCYAYGLLARGLRDVVVDAGLKPYDILALVPIIEGAGGKITDWNGAPVTLHNHRDVVAVGDAALLSGMLA